jgi:hypothetical protein
MHLSEFSKINKTLTGKAHSVMLVYYLQNKLSLKMAQRAEFRQNLSNLSGQTELLNCNKSE